MKNKTSLCLACLVLVTLLFQFCTKINDYNSIPDETDFVERKDKQQKSSIKNAKLRLKNSTRDDISASDPQTLHCIYELRKLSGEHGNGIPGMNLTDLFCLPCEMDCEESIFMEMFYTDEDGKEFYDWGDLNLVTTDTQDCFACWEGMWEVELIK